MSIIIQTGHRSSNSKLLMQKLYNRGLSEPLHSYTHQLTSQQIADTIFKVISRNSTAVTNNKLIDNVMTDFLLSNLDFENWGWESEKNLMALEYWQETASDVIFILVFDHPSNLLNQISSQAMTVDLLNQIMSDWVSYHQNMLDFLENNQNKALLIEGKCAIDNISKLSEKLKTIANTLQLKSSWQVSNQIEDNSKHSLDHQSNIVKDHVFEEVLSQYPEVIRLFNALLDKAAIKDSNSIYKLKKTNINSLVSLLNHLQESDLAEKYHEQQVDNSFLKETLDEVNKDKKEIEKKYIEIKNILDRRTSEKKIDTNKCTNELEVTNQLLMEQLQLAQEKIEEYYLNLGNTKESIVSNSNKIYPKGAAEALKKELPYILGSTIITHSKSVKGIVKLPASLLHEHKNFKSNKSIPSSIEMYADSVEAEKVKRHLSYKIGKVFVESFDSPINFIILPFKMIKEVKDFKKK